MHITERKYAVPAALMAIFLMCATYATYAIVMRVPQSQACERALDNASQHLAYYDGSARWQRAADVASKRYEITCQSIGVR